MHCNLRPPDTAVVILRFNWDARHMPSSKSVNLSVPVSQRFYSWYLTLRYDLELDLDPLAIFTARAEKPLLWSFQSEILTSLFRDPDFLKKSNDLAIRLRFYAVTFRGIVIDDLAHFHLRYFSTSRYNFDRWPLDLERFVVDPVSRDQTLLSEIDNHDELLIV